MEWTGVRDNSTDMSPAGKTTVAFLENASLVVEGECSRRPGFGAVIGNSGIRCAELGAYVIFVKDDGTIVSETQ